MELSNDMRKALQAANKAAKKAGDSFLGVDTLLRALLEAKDVATALSEAGKHALPGPFQTLPELSAAFCAFKWRLPS